MTKEINDLIERYIENIVDTSLLYIPKEQQQEYIINIIELSLFHKHEIEIILRDKIKNDT